MSSSVHICNIANVAYSNCKILKEHGAEVKLATHDLKHLMSQPEWQDLDLAPEMFADEWDFYGGWETACRDFGGYERPPWYFDTCISYVGTAPSKWSRMIRSLREDPRIGKTFQAIYLPVWRSARWANTVRKTAVAAVMPKDALTKRVRKMCNLNRSFGKEWKVGPGQLFAHLGNAYWLDQFTGPEDVLFGYVSSAIYGMLVHENPVVAVEIGTIRDIPFDGTAEGKVVALMYRAADHVLITNPDNKMAADRLGITRYSFCPHPVDEATYRPLEGGGRLGEDGRPLVILAPARQNWKEKGNDKLYRALAEVLRRGLKMELHVPEWGQDLDRSRELVKALGIGDAIRWMAPQSEGRLIRSYQECDIVADQFVHGVFGLITPKAMSCGRPVVTSYKRELNSWCFPEDPPLLAATAEPEIVTQLEKLGRDQEFRREVGRESRAWVEKYHSKDAVYRALAGADDAARGEAERRRSQS